jgi:hypothetical protein
MEGGATDVLEQPEAPPSITLLTGFKRASPFAGFQGAEPLGLTFLKAQ